VLPLPAKYFLPYQVRWKNDAAPLRICQKGRQIGISYVDQYDSVLKAAVKRGKDVWVVSRDEVQAKQYIAGSKRWARILGYAAEDLGEQIFTLASGQPVKVQVLHFASGASIYALSSSPDAIAGKTGHVKLDEFALHKDQRSLYAVAKPVTQWGGTLSIISTHRGPSTVFNQIITDIKERGNPMGWSLHTIPIELAVSQGLVEKIDAATGGALAATLGVRPSPAAASFPHPVNPVSLREAWLARVRAECIDEEQWNQEYCCIPADENTAFLSYDLIHSCEDPHLHLLSLEQLLASRPDHRPSLFLGMDVARRHNLCVIDVGEKIGDVVWDRLRLTFQDVPFSQVESALHQLLRLPSLKRACLDATGLGIQLGERAREAFGPKVEPLNLTAPLKEEIACALRADFEDRKLRIVHHDKLRADLRGLKKLVTAAGHIRFDGHSDDSHCDRTWAMALRQHAARYRRSIGARLG
jgi:phage FluMu gp28-like protein